MHAGHPVFENCCQHAVCSLAGKGCSDNRPAVYLRLGSEVDFSRDDVIRKASDEVVEQFRFGFRQRQKGVSAGDDFCRLEAEKRADAAASPASAPEGAFDIAGSRRRLDESTPVCVVAVEKPPGLSGEGKHPSRVSGNEAGIQCSNNGAVRKNREVASGVVDYGKQCLPVGFSKLRLGLCSGQIQIAGAGKISLLF